MIKLFLTDVDGTLTDGGRYLDSDGKELKRFYIPDGTGLVTLKKMGVKTGIITAEKGKLVEIRAQQLKLDIVRLDCHNKLQEALKLCEDYGCTLKDIAFIGDDINDYELLTKVGFAACPGDAQNIIKNIPQIYITKTRGGEGAVREFINHLVGEKELLRAFQAT